MRRRACLLALALVAVGPVEAQPATLELNTASLAQLESLPGIGPALAERLLAARVQRTFEDWNDLHRRVRGIGPATAAKLSAQGLRVNGRAYEAPAAAGPASGG
ncbi:ComEA family DNA-binding protein [Roseateles violae]|uniref:DUF655 domain-containing protein n=1 Tax=Roseateles violae TaxID=3058042 RepID=A0ABT8DPA5_9BURK|nr:DUF655 domain-containing protein [Pelomonas sp. PFR6]MDN3920187.1 DUF655 domain-containing protein [Pelomonas sp. PFR6]